MSYDTTVADAIDPPQPRISEPSASPAACKRWPLRGTSRLLIAFVIAAALLAVAVCVSISTGAAGARNGTAPQVKARGMPAD